MTNEDFSLDGVSAKSLGIHLQNPVEIGEAEPVTESVQIPGRNGTLAFETGAFYNRKGTASCFALSQGVVSKMANINRFLLPSGGYRRLELNCDEEHFMLARVKNGARLSQRMRVLAPFEIEFDIKPQRFLKEGENTLSFTESGRDLENPYGFVALPIIKVYGSGEGSFYVGGYVVTIKDMTDFLIFDSETQNAYNSSGNQNLYISAAEFPVISPGTNAVGFSGGVTKIEITGSVAIVAEGTAYL